MTGSGGREAVTEIRKDFGTPSAGRTGGPFERARTEAALSETEQRRTFLLELSDAISSAADSVAIVQAASRLLGNYLRSDETTYCENDGEIGSPPTSMPNNDTERCT